MTPDPLTPSPDSPLPQNPQGEKPKQPHYVCKEHHWFDSNVLCPTCVERMEKAALVKEREAIVREGREAVRKRDNQIELLQREHDFQKRHSAELQSVYEETERERQSYLSERNELRATLAERDREIEWLKKRLTNTPARMQEMERETDSLRAQLAETQEKLKEAEKAHDQLMERYKTTHDHWIAAEERWKQVQQTLIRVQAEYAEREDSQPDLTLIEEVREGLEKIQACVGFPHVTDASPVPNLVAKLLTRLNPRK